jgi:hypothetical protein
MTFFLGTKIHEMSGLIDFEADSVKTTDMIQEELIKLDAFLV